MEIKKFKEVSNLQKKEIYKLIKSLDVTYNKSLIEMNSVYESDVFNEGNNVFILFDCGQIKGSIAVITKEISVRGEAFITDVYIENENIENKLYLLLKEIFDYCDICNARNIKIGIRESETHLIPYINKLKFTHIYDAVVMKYRGNKNIVLKANKEIELLPLSILNSHEYMNIQNQAFINSPNGSTIDEFEVKDYIVQYTNDEDLIGICFTGKKPCGVYELSINRDVGWINTLGIAPVFQNKGLGKALIVKCIEKLRERKIDQIKLLVITTNYVAVKMYRDSGFIDEKVFSYWFQKNIY
ncbi:GNAT family N-acetyltransferase [Clostridium sp.]|uniref:GNAT family N-acetyltransferase n=1 Tax=Clostridium sp. TaxID=1506 RepID=UPI003D6D909B